MIQLPHRRLDNRNKGSLLRGSFLFFPLRHFFSCATLFTVAVLTGCNTAEQSSAQTYTVRPKTFEVKIQEVGAVEARRVVPIMAPSEGKLIFLPETGKFVQQGELVMEMEAQEAIDEVNNKLDELKRLKEDLEANVESLKIALSRSSLDVDLAESELEFNRIRLEDVTLQLAETEVLLQRSVVPEDDLRDARSSLTTTRLNTQGKDLDLQSNETATLTESADYLSKIEQSKIRSEGLIRELSIAEAKISQAKMMAPVSGLFQRKPRWDWTQDKMVEPKPGEDVRTGQILGEIPDLATLMIRTQIPERYFLEVREGSNATVTFDAIKGSSTKARVKSVSKVAIDRKESAGGTLMQTNQKHREKVFEVELELENPPQQLKPGISASVEIILHQVPDSITIPLAALNKSSEGYSVRVRKGISTEDRPVVLGMENGSDVVILEGIASGDVVLLPEQGGNNKSNT
ncbi:MAG: HlyD family efflux transporter periplasmic adaptor subunit [Candidatus Sumerlaeia bacterium]|nr:HlyD family efflux transporter periplasmic adaptor subunit [Candidatus Sumerlaeia bacterium]